MLTRLPSPPSTRRRRRGGRATRRFAGRLRARRRRSSPPPPTASAPSCLARSAGRLRAAGARPAAHCINDVLTTGAEPLFLLDYVAADGSTREVAELVEGAADVAGRPAAPSSAARRRSCPGSTARRSSTPRARASDRRARRGSSTARVGAGRRRGRPPLVGYPRERVLARAADVGEGDVRRDLLLPPTRLYLADVRALRTRADVRGLAHITGGGLAANLARACPPGSAPSSIRRGGRGLLSSSGSQCRACRRASCAVSSTSASASARSSAAGDVTDADLVIGRIDGGREGVAWADA